MTIRPPNTQIITDPMLISVLTIAGNALSIAAALASVLYHSWFSFLNRFAAPSSFVNDLTTRMPGIVSVSTDATAVQRRHMRK